MVACRRRHFKSVLDALQRAALCSPPHPVESLDSKDEPLLVPHPFLASSASSPSTLDVKQQKERNQMPESADDAAEPANSDSESECSKRLQHEVHLRTKQQRLTAEGSEDEQQEIIQVVERVVRRPVQTISSKLERPKSATLTRKPTTTTSHSSRDEDHRPRVQHTSRTSNNHQSSTSLDLFSYLVLLEQSAQCTRKQQPPLEFREKRCIVPPRARLEQPSYLIVLVEDYADVQQRHDAAARGLDQEDALQERTRVLLRHAQQGLVLETPIQDAGKHLRYGARAINKQQQPAQGYFSLFDTNVRRLDHADVVQDRNIVESTNLAVQRNQCAPERLGATHRSKECPLVLRQLDHKQIVCQAPVVRDCDNGEWLFRSKESDDHDDDSRPTSQENDRATESAVLANVLAAEKSALDQRLTARLMCLVSGDNSVHLITTFP
ncbi:hypothetical protein FI667_g10216, partial [Globisporangium splendens]